MRRTVSLGAPLNPRNSAAETVGGTESVSAEIGRIDLLYVATRCGTVPIGTILPPILISTPSPVDALRCRFSDVLSLQVMRWLSGPAEKLPLRVAEGRTESGECVRPLVARASVCGAFKHAFSRLGCQALKSVALLRLWRYR